MTEIITMTNRLAQLAVALVLAGAGCSHNKSPAVANTGVPVPAASGVDDGEPGGAELWAANCSRCHNLRPPQSFSNTQWETIVHHMRLRANLTGEEARAITEFLQASN